MNRFLKELSRRHVIRIAIAYAVVAWLLIEVTATTFPILELPDWSVTVVTAFVLLGFPLALIFTWAFEITPEGVKLEKHVDRATSIAQQTGRKLDFGIIGFLAIALAYFMYTHDWFDYREEAGDIKSIAVLPFANRSAAEENAEFFAAGVHDDLLTLLSKVGDLKVISRTSVERLDPGMGMRAIGEELGVATVLEGGVQRVGDQVRINVQLIDARTDEHLWAHTYDRELTAANVFAIQSEIANAITAALQAQLSPRDQANINKVPTRNLDALYQHQLGRQRLVKRSSGAIQDAMDHFERAIELDPDYALAWVSLAESTQMLSEYGNLSFDDAAGRTEMAIDKALSLDPDLGEAYASLGLLNRQLGRLSEANTAFQRAMELNPNYASTYHWHSLVLRRQGRWEEALAMILRARDLNPLSPVINETAAESMKSLGRFDEARAYLEKVIEIDPAFPGGYRRRGLLRWFLEGDLVAASGDFEQVIAVDPGRPGAYANLGLLYLDLGDAKTAKSWVDEARELGPDHERAQFSAAALYLYQGDLEESQRHLRRFQKIAPAWFRTLIMFPRSGVTGDTAVRQIAWYQQHYPELTGDDPPVDSANVVPTIDLARILQVSGRTAQAERLLERALQAISEKPRLGTYGYLIMDVEILALQGRTDEALTALREAIDAGWRVNWWFARFDPNLDSIRDHPEFQAMMAELEADMAAQRAELEAEGLLTMTGG